jgi:hypothetical protein
VKPGDFGLTQIHGGVGVAIRVGQWLMGDGFADYQHAFVLVSNSAVVEAEPGGARLAHLAEYDLARVAWYSCPPESAEGICQNALALLGTPYSFLDYAALAAVRLGAPAALVLRRYVASTGHMICSQLVDEAYRRAGVHLYDDGRLPGDVTPLDLDALILAQGRERLP